jgi:hypothetical protein
VKQFITHRVEVFERSYVSLSAFHSGNSANSFASVLLWKNGDTDGSQPSASMI